MGSNDYCGCQDLHPAPRPVSAGARLKLEIEGLRAALKEAGDVIECYHKNTGLDLGAASRMPFYADTMLKIDAALKEPDQ
jgi:hypothetical protein